MRGRRGRRRIHPRRKETSHPHCRAHNDHGLHRRLRPDAVVRRCLRRQPRESHGHGRLGRRDGDRGCRAAAEPRPLKGRRHLRQRRLDCWDLRGRRCHGHLQPRRQLAPRHHQRRRHHDDGIHRQRRHDAVVRRTSVSAPTSGCSACSPPARLRRPRSSCCLPD